MTGPRGILHFITSINNPDSRARGQLTSFTQTRLPGPRGSALSYRPAERAGDGASRRPANGFGDPPTPSANGTGRGEGGGGTVATETATLTVAMTSHPRSVPERPGRRTTSCVRSESWGGVEVLGAPPQFAMCVEETRSQPASAAAATQTANERPYSSRTEEDKDVCPQTSNEPPLGHILPGHNNQI